MGFSFRKSFSSAPFRINFSRSGISYSLGVKGARIRFGNKGTYVSFGSGGIHYRKRITDTRPPQPPAPGGTVPPINTPHTITSADAESITDTDSQDFINELTEKGKKISYHTWLGLVPLVLLACAFVLAFFSPGKRTSIDVPEVKTFVLTQSDAVNIRRMPSGQSDVLGQLRYGTQLELLDGSDSSWYKVDYNGQAAYVSKKFTGKANLTTTHEEWDPATGHSLFEDRPGLFWTLLLAGTLLFSILLPWLRHVDRRRLLVEIYYDLDEGVSEVYDKFVQHFSALLGCSRVWQYLHAQPSRGYKYSSGATTTITRQALTRISKNKAPAQVFRTNVAIPYLGLVNTELFFFPERLIVRRGGRYGAIMYKNIDCFSRYARFIESDTLPGDAVVVDHTWRFLNRDGRPDRRFNNNYQLPVCRYSEYSFRSDSGLNEMIATSKPGAFDEFIRYINAIGNLQKRMDEEKRNRRMLGE